MTDDELRAYIHGKLAESRQFGSTKERVHSVVKFERPEALDNEVWRSNAIAALSTFENKATWAEVYIRCGRCKREWDAWLAENPVTDPLDEWIAKAKSVVIEKRWI